MNAIQISTIIRNTPLVNCYGEQRQIIARPLDVILWWRQTEQSAYAIGNTFGVPREVCRQNIIALSAAIEDIGGGIGYAPIAKFLRKVSKCAH